MAEVMICKTLTLEEQYERADKAALRCIAVLCLIMLFSIFGLLLLFIE